MEVRNIPLSGGGWMREIQYHDYNALVELSKEYQRQGNKVFLGTLCDGGYFLEVYN